MKIMVKGSGTDKWQKVEEKAFNKEKALQELPVENPDLIPVEMLGDERKPIRASGCHLKNVWGSARRLTVILPDEQAVKQFKEGLAAFAVTVPQSGSVRRLLEGRSYGSDR